MNRIILFAGICVLTAGLGSARAQESEFYKKPTNTAEFWRALQFEISVGKFDVAAAHLKGLLDSNPKDDELLAIEARDGLVAFLRLRNVERWSRDKALEKEARENTEKLIELVNTALKNELSNPARITKFARNLTATPEEAAYALKELIRSGVDAIPILIELLRGDQPAAQRAAILEIIPALDGKVVPPLIACLDTSEAALKLELLDALRKRKDYITFSSRVETDLLPYLWYFSAPLPKNPALLRKKAEEMLLGLLDRPPGAERIEEQRLPQWRLAQYTRAFLEHKVRFGTPEQPVVWKWDGSRPIGTPMSLSDAEEYYGLRYGKWALEIQPEYAEAQKAFITLALEKHIQRAGPDSLLSKTSPALYGILATATFELLSDLTETYLREQRAPLATALLQVIGDRDETRAARPSDRPGASSPATDFRPSLLLKALDFPDRQVRFAAVEALLKSPNPQVQLRSAAIVKLLAGYLQADSGDEGAKARAAIGDPDQVRAQMLAGVMRQAGYEVDIYKTGRDLIRRLQERADVDLVVIDHHLPYPLFGDTLAQLRADLRTKALPLVVVASPDQPTTAHPITLLGRLAALAAAEEHIEFAKNQAVYDDPRRDQPSSRFKKRLDTLRKLVASAGIQVSPDVEDRLEYLTFLMTSIDIPAPGELERTRLIVPSPDREDRMNALRYEPQRGHIAANVSPFANTKDLTPALAVIVARYEIALPPAVLELAKVYWKVMQNGVRSKDGRIVIQDGLPDVALRHLEVEARANSVVKGYRKVRVIPEVLTADAFKEELQGFVIAQDPKQREAEKKSQAKSAMEWLRKMAVGELTGYPVTDAASTIRQALQNPELAALAIDAVVRFPGKEAQQDIANVILGPLAAEVRGQAVDALIKHIQQRGRMLSDPQIMLLTEKAASEADAAVKSRLLALRGILQADPTATGMQLLDFNPSPPAEPKEKKEEPKN